MTSFESPDATNTIDESREQVYHLGRLLFKLFARDPSLSRLIFVEALGISDEIDQRIQMAFGALILGAP
ncbi:hypothetical protein WDW89_02880 [Deltaproteobacteria bacterium TL4]